MPVAPEFRDIISDPDFRQLPAQEKIKALDQLYPDEFKGMEPKEKVAAITRALQQIPIKGTAPTPGFWGTVGETLGGMAQAGRQKIHELRHPIMSEAEDLAFSAQHGAAAKQAFKKGQYGQAAKEWAKTALGPTGTGVASESFQQLRKAKSEASSAMDPRMNPIDRLITLGHAAGHVGGAVPFVGPAAAQAGEEFQQQGLGSGQAWAHTAMLLGPDVVSAGLGLAGGAVSAGARNALKSRLSGTALARYQRMEARAAARGFQGEMLTRGERLGPTATGGMGPLERIERGQQYVLGGAGPAEAFYGPRAGELEGQARESIAAVSPTSQPGREAFDVAQDVYDEAGQTIKRQQNTATRVYNGIRAATPDTTITIGSRQLADGSFQRIDATYQAPVPLKPYRTGLRPLYNEYRSRFKDLTEAQRMADPGYASLHRIMTDTDPLTPGKLRQYMSAMDLEKEMGGIKGLMRSREMAPFLYGPSGRIQIRMIQNGDKMIKAALNRAKPGLGAELTKGQRIVQGYKTAERLVQKIVGRVEKGQPVESMRVYNAMTAAKDTKYATTAALMRIAPNTGKALARQYLEGLIETATKDLGKLKGGAGVGLVNGFEKLGGKTRNLFFGPKLAGEIEDAFENIKSLMPAEGSPTAWRLPALGALGAGIEALQRLITGHPIRAAGVAANVATLGLGANILSRIMFMPGGALNISRMLRMAKIGGAGLREASRVFMAHEATATEAARRADQAKREAAGRPDVPAPGAAGPTPAGPQAAQGPSPPTPEPAMPEPSETEGLPRPTGQPFPIPPALAGQPQAQATPPPPTPEAAPERPPPRFQQGPYPYREAAAPTRLEGLPHPEERPFPLPRALGGQREPPRGTALGPAIAQAIERQEAGTKAGNRAERNNNPGNLKPKGFTYPGQTGVDKDGFAKFDSYESGHAALMRQVMINIRRGLNLTEFFGGKKGGYPGFAPKEDKNDPVSYAQKVADALGIDTEIPLATFLAPAT